MGGVFFRSKDQQRLAAWYAEHLGIDVEVPEGNRFDLVIGHVAHG